MNIFTRKQLREQAMKACGCVDMPFTYSTKRENMVNSALNESRTYLGTTIFLSHSHHDAELVKDIVALLKSVGISVYVDWMDDSMPTKTCGSTAEKIKQKIRENQKFIFLATNAALESKWCNWEIGVGDIIKHSSNNMAIWAVKEDNTEWEGNEYLQLYPSVRLVNGEITVVHAGCEYTGDSLTTWIQKR